jgi:hypothetical protein
MHSTEQDGGEASQYAAEQAAIGRRCLGAALYYLSRGWCAVPLCHWRHDGVGRKHASECKSPGKAVIVRWTELQERLSTRKELEGWWAWKPWSGVGVLLGPVSRLIAVDIDGPTAEAKLLELSGGDLSGALEFKTPRPGRRLLWELPDGVERSIGTWSFDDGELKILAKGSMTVMPPSPHHAGSFYEWVSPLGEKMGPIPEWFVKAESPQKARKARKPRAATTTATAEPGDGEKVPEGGRRTHLLSVAGTLRHQGKDADAIAEALAAENNAVCEPPLPQDEVDGLAEDVAERYEPDGMAGVKIVLPAKAEANGTLIPLSLSSHPPPEPMAVGEDALYGLAGRIVRLISPATEADPVAILGQALVAFGNVIGRTAHYRVGATPHYCNEFLVLAGKTSRSRKGTSWDWVWELFKGADSTWAAERVKSGLVSGEGVVWAIRDRIVKRDRVKERGEAARYEEVEVDPGVSDKRLRAEESEFARVLACAQRDGSVLSEHLRQLWDGKTLETLAKNNPARATDPHGSMTGHITIAELLQQLTSVQIANGLANRILWLLVARSKILPDGGTIDPAALEAVRTELANAVGSARRQGEMKRDDAARALWHEVYPKLTADRDGLAGAITARAEAHVLRLSMIYALLDQSALIKEAHLRAALAFWDYCDRSVAAIFGELLGDPLADELLRMLRAAPAGLTRTEISGYLGHHVSSARISLALGALLGKGLARSEVVATAGRSAERWLACG